MPGGASYGGRHGPYNSPDEIETLNPREFYFDGIFENYVPPQLGYSWRPLGSAYAPPSDYRKTRADGHRPGSRDRGRQDYGFAEDITGNPWGSLEPGQTQGGAPGAESLFEHDPYPDPLGDPRTQEALLAPPAPEDMPSTGLGGLLGNLPGGNWLKGVYATSPVAALFITIAGVVALNALFFKSRSIGRATSSATSAATTPSRAATSGAESAVDAVNDVVADAAKAVDDIVPG